ncbi:hypothetical protein CBFG_01641 [Clostridiales bacterium 1_7_47FAA]|nr:hypothetical protein CBFG_01641 [Clostridiales bacterium 1_7_47FAA]
MTLQCTEPCCMTGKTVPSAVIGRYLTGDTIEEYEEEKENLYGCE